MPEQTVPGMRYNWLPHEEKYGRAIERLEDACEALCAERDRLRREFSALLEAAEDMRCYVPEHFASKWGHDEVLARARRVLPKVRDLKKAA